MTWQGDRLDLLDQTRLPADVVLVSCVDVAAVARAISDMVVRGAPAIGVAAAFGLVLAARAEKASSRTLALAAIEAAVALLTATRPTAVNLAWALARMRQRAAATVGDGGVIWQALEAEARAIHDEDVATNQAIGRHGERLVPPGARVLTHCNAGALATVAYGTALGVIRAAHAAGKGIHVWVDETRPWLQGARLTAWELMQEHIPATLVTDSMAGYLMARRQVDLVVTGADRIAVNGDTANKIGTYGLAVLAHAHDIPFYIAAPLSTIDRTMSDGSAIVIEERPAREVTHIAGQPIAPSGMPVFNPAFDVTPARLITAIITERGLLSPPYGPAITASFAQKPASNFS